MDAEFLKQREEQYGGRIVRPCRILSPSDKMAPDQTHLSGGDRMRFNGYGEAYAAHLPSGGVAVEVGVLMGQGLALWCDLFDRVIGLDIDLSNYDPQFLFSRGAFGRIVPEVYRYDQFLDGTAYLKWILKGDKVNMVTDDGAHYVQSALTTFRSFEPYLAKGFVYFVEDNFDFAAEFKKLFKYRVTSYGNLTVINDLPE